MSVLTNEMPNLTENAKVLILSKLVVDPEGDFLIFEVYSIILKLTVPSYNNYSNLTFFLIFQVMYGPIPPTPVKVNCRLKCFVTLVIYCYNNVFVYFNL
jgi:hypothetical protein